MAGEQHGASPSWLQGTKSLREQCNENMGEGQNAGHLRTGQHLRS